jgi:large subunit ribosomal protein L15
MQLHTLKRTHEHRKGQRIGRGGKRGTTAGRGTKGQKARAGHKIRPQLRDFIKRIPKLRGSKFPSINTRLQTVTLESIEQAFSNGDTIHAKTLLEKGLVIRRHGLLAYPKVVGNKISKKVSLVGIRASGAARAAIEKAGGSIR